MVSIGMRSEELEREIEIALVRAFGWSIIEFEASLFQKFLVMSAPSSLMTEDMFRKHMKNMEAKGYVAPVDFQGKRAWKRLIIESDFDEKDLTPEEVKDFIEKAKLEDRKKKTKKKKGEKSVSESKALAEIILRYLEMGMPSRVKVKRRIGEPTLIDHIGSLHHALAESKESFLKYVRKNLPRVYDEMEEILNTKGEEVLLRSLRVIESGQRTYPPQ
jgi:glutamyl/glutaminyl-tRNA synthetase